MQKSDRGNHRNVEWISISGAGIGHLAPLVLHIYATNFIAAARVAPEVNERFAPAKLYLVCHAIELLLKAFLSTKGKTLNDLADLGGHKLAKVAGRCRIPGIVERGKASV